MKASLQKAIGIALLFRATFATTGQPAAFGIAEIAHWA
jgi:hypothetical protein